MQTLTAADLKKNLHDIQDNVVMQNLRNSPSKMIELIDPVIIH